MYYTKRFQGPRAVPSDPSTIAVGNGWFTFRPLRLWAIYDRLYHGPALLTRVNHATGQHLRRLLDNGLPDDGYRVRPLGDAKEQCDWELTFPIDAQPAAGYFRDFPPSVRVCSERRPWRGRRAGHPRPNPFWGLLVMIPGVGPFLWGDDGTVYTPDDPRTPKRLYDLYDARATVDGRRMLAQVRRFGWHIDAATV